MVAKFKVSKDGTVFPSGYIGFIPKRNESEASGSHYAAKKTKPGGWWTMVGTSKGTCKSSAFTRMLKLSLSLLVPKKQWKPITLRAPILGGLIIFSLSMVAVLEVLSYMSSGNGNMNGGAVAFAANANESNDPSSLATFT